MAVINDRTKGHMPKATVFTASANAPLTTAAVKRYRFIQNLKANHQNLIDALITAENYAVFCDLSVDQIQSIRDIRTNVIAELTMKLEERLRAYDARVGGRTI